ncbi:MAG TPA: response regulator [Pyrinomonadaceae bacterium]|nr:response regulator [Pyrinomonadaceae bacterium]
MAEKNRKPTILLVEDYPETRTMLRQWLERKGYRLVEAADGQEALDLAPLAHPDLILMDLRLPEMNGIAATRRLREHPELKDVPVIALSALDPAMFRDAAMAVGCVDYLTKPIDLDELEELLIRLLGYRPVAAKTVTSRR